MPVLRLSQEHLTAPILHRTSVTLAFLEHFYVHSHPAPVGSLTIPASVAVPLIQVSTLLGLPPILTYATTVLYNVVPRDPEAIFDAKTNPPIRCHANFTGLRSEDQFYLVSSLVELHGVRALDIMRQALDEAFVGDRLALRRITAYLRALASAIDDLRDVMKTMRDGCDPAEFYHLIRPWFKGSDGEGPGGLGWLFEGVGEEGEGERRIVSGPSAGQSSLVHALDLFLGVDHSPRSPSHAGPPSSAAGPSTAAPTAPAAKATDAKPVSKGDATFMQRMLQYMPGPHRQFLLHLQANSVAVRDLVLANQDFEGGSLARAYDDAVSAMGRFRDYHFVIVTTYIIQQARRPPPAHILALMNPVPAVAEAIEEETVKAVDPAWRLGTEKLPVPSPPPRMDDGHDDEEAADEPIRGTGGTALAQFLKLCKARTVENIIGRSE